MIIENKGEIVLLFTYIIYNNLIYVLYISSLHFQFTFSLINRAGIPAFIAFSCSNCLFTIISDLMVLAKIYLSLYNTLQTQQSFTISRQNYLYVLSASIIELLSPERTSNFTKEHTIFSNFYFTSFYGNQLGIGFNGCISINYYFDNVGKIVPLRRMKQYCCVGVNRTAASE